MYFNVHCDLELSKWTYQHAQNGWINYQPQLITSSYPSRSTISMIQYPKNINILKILLILSIYVLQCWTLNLTKPKSLTLSRAQPSNHLSIYLPICLSVCLSIYAHYIYIYVYSCIYVCVPLDFFFILATFYIPGFCGPSIDSFPSIPPWRIHEIFLFQPVIFLVPSGKLT